MNYPRKIPFVSQDVVTLFRCINAQFTNDVRGTDNVISVPASSRYNRKLCKWCKWSDPCRRHNMGPQPFCRFADKINTSAPVGNRIPIPDSYKITNKTQLYGIIYYSLVPRLLYMFPAILSLIIRNI
jgi:hypothetical protein